MKASLKKLIWHLLRLVPTVGLRNRLRAWLYRRKAYWPIELLVEGNDNAVQVGTPKLSTVKSLLWSTRPNGRAVVFEAASENFLRLRTRCAAAQKLDTTRLDLVKRAVFDSRQTLTLRLSGVFPGDNVLAGLETTMDNEDRPGASFPETEEVQADTLDNLLSNLGIQPTVIIVTVNGGEARVLAGARKTLGNMQRGARLFVKTHARKSPRETIQGEVITALTDLGFVAVRTRPSESVSARADWRLREGDVFAYRP